MRSKISPLPNITWLTKMKSCPPDLAAAMNRSERVANGSGGVRSITPAPAPSHPAHCPRAPRELPARAVEFAVAGEGPDRPGRRDRGKQADQELVRIRGEHDRIRLAGTE